MQEPPESEARALVEIEVLMRQIVEGQAVPYDAGWEIWGKAMSAASGSSELMHPLWLIWGALTDWVENRPSERKEAEEKMRQAAREWLEIDRDNPAERKTYLDRWVFDEMCYERESPSD